MVLKVPHSAAGWISCLWLPIGLFAAACATESTVSIPAPNSTEQKSTHLDLDVCVFWGTRGVNTDAWLAEKFQVSSHLFFRSVKGVLSLEDAEGCDMAVKVSYRNFGYSLAEAYSAYSHAPVLSAKTKSSAGMALLGAINSEGGKVIDESVPSRLGAAIYEALQTNPALFQGLLQERDAYAARKKKEERRKKLAEKEDMINAVEAAVKKSSKAKGAGAITPAVDSEDATPAATEDPLP